MLSPLVRLPDGFSISLMFASVLALLQVPMTVAVGLRRVRTGIQFLDAGDVRLLRLMRAHANFVETVPMALIAMVSAELLGAPRALLAAGGLLLVTGRVLHYVTLLRSGFGIGRAIGMAATLVAIAVFAAYALVISFGRLFT